MIRTWFAWFLASACFGLAGCAAEACPEGEVERDGVCVSMGGVAGDPDAGGMPDMDASVDEDTRRTRDAGSEPASDSERDSGKSGPATSDPDAGDMKEPDAGEDDMPTPVPFCETATCDDNARCDDSADQPVCTCNEGYEGNGMQCTRNECVPFPGDPEPCGMHASCEDPSPSIGSSLECTCDESFASCDGDRDPTPGCETNLQTSAEHCGACGDACAGSLACKGGKCEQALESLTLGYQISCGVEAHRSTARRGLVCWGSNLAFRMRDDAVSHALNDPDGFRAAAETVPDIGAVRDVAVGPYHSCVLESAADIVTCWGVNQLGRFAPDESPNVDELVRLHEPGTIDLAIGNQHTCLLRSDGSVGCWGSDASGGLGRGDSNSGTSASVTAVEEASDVAQIAADNEQTCARSDAGRVWCWGAAMGGTPQAIRSQGGSILDDALHVDVGGAVGGDSSKDHACALRKNGRVVCWGGNPRGALGNGSIDPPSSTGRYVEVGGLSNIIDVAAGGAHTCALDDGGQVYCWGWNRYNLLGLRSDAGVVIDGQRVVLEPMPLPGLDDVTDIEASNFHTCTRRGSGQVVCWGRNTFGQLGDGTAIAREDIRDVVGLP